MKDGLGFKAFIVGLVMGALLGWGYGHSTIASECQRLNGFYVGKVTYTCWVRDKRE